MTLLDLSPADFRRFLTVLVDRRLLGSQCCLSTTLVANGIRLTKRCKRCDALSSRSDVTSGMPDLGKSFTLLACVFSHQSADYSIVVARMTSNNFEGHPCCRRWTDNTMVKIKRASNEYETKYILYIYN